MGLHSSHLNGIATAKVSQTTPARVLRIARRAIFLMFKGGITQRKNDSKCWDGCQEGPRPKGGTVRMVELGSGAVAESEARKLKFVMDLTERWEWKLALGQRKGRGQVPGRRAGAGDRYR